MRVGSDVTDVQGDNCDQQTNWAVKMTTFHCPFVCFDNKNGRNTKQNLLLNVKDGFTEMHLTFDLPGHFLTLFQNCT